MREDCVWGFGVELPSVALCMSFLLSTACPVSGCRTSSAAIRACLPPDVRRDPRRPQPSAIVGAAVRQPSQREAGSASQLLGSAALSDLHASLAGTSPGTRLLLENATAIPHPAFRPASRLSWAVPPDLTFLSDRRRTEGRRLARPRTLTRSASCPPSWGLETRSNQAVAAPCACSTIGLRSVTTRPTRPTRINQG